MTVALYFFGEKEKRNAKLFWVYIAGELSGFIVGVCLSDLIYDHGGPLVPVLPDAIELGKECIEEAVATFLLVFFILLVNTESTTFL